MGLNFERDKLCLVQISSGKNDAHIIKLDRNKYDAPNLKKIFLDKKINKIFHFARADMTFIKKYLKVSVENVSCTKIMSKIARSYSDKHLLKDLIKEFIGIYVSKQLQTSDFGGDLSENSFNIVRMTSSIFIKFLKDYKKYFYRKRMDLYENTIKFIHTRVELDLSSYSEDIWSH